MLFAAHCAECHAERRQPISDMPGSAPVVTVSTDPKMVLNANSNLQPGSLHQNSLLPPPAVGTTFKRSGESQSDPERIGRRPAARRGVHSARSSRRQSSAQSGVWRSIAPGFRRHPARRRLRDLLNPDHLADLKALIKSRLNNMFDKAGSAGGGAASQVAGSLRHLGDRAVCHNGSVPNLWELLTPPKSANRAYGGRPRCSIRRMSAMRPINRRRRRTVPS